MIDNRIQRIVVLVAVFFLTALVANATRPGADEVAKNRCLTVMWELYRSFEKLSPAQFEEMTGRRSGVQPVDHRVLQYLMAHDPQKEENELYDLVMEVEAGYSHCHYYCVFNLDRLATDTVVDHSFVILDTTHGFQRDFRDDKRSENSSPRAMFQNFCSIFNAGHEYEKYAAEFSEESEYSRKLKKAKARENPYMSGLARFWPALLVFMILDFVFIDMRYLKGQKEGLKMYCFGLHLASFIIVMSFVTLHYTGTPIPDLKSFSHLVNGAYPQELHFLSDVILFTSFGWWGISILAIFIAGEERGLSYLATFYVLFAPLTLAMSESPFRGSDAFPLFGFLAMLLNALYVKSKAPKPDIEPEQEPDSY